MNKNRKGNQSKPLQKGALRQKSAAPAAPPFKNPNPQPQKDPAIPSAENLLKGRSLYFFLALALLLALFIFRNFISFTNLYLYKDIGSDTVTYWWPHWVNLSNCIHNLGIPTWSFNQGMGQNIYAFGIGDPFSLFLCLLPKDAIPYAIIFMELIKIIGGGLLIYLFLRTIECSRAACIAGGLLFAFGGYMILGSGWYFVSTEAFYAALLLYSVEKFLRNGIWYLLPLPFCLFGIFQPFFLYLYGLFAVVYCIVRSLLGKPDSKKIAVQLLQMGALALFGVLLGSVVFLPNAYQLVNNPRVGGGASQFHALISSPLFQLSPGYINASTISRLFSNDLLGAGSNFKGWGNYLEAPILYIGLVSLLLAPQAFLFFDGRKRKILLIFTILCIAPLAFTWFRYAFWLFQVPYFRTYTFFISLLILFLAVKALTGIEKSGKVHWITLAATLAILLFLLYHDFAPGYSRVVNSSRRNTAAAYLVLYSGLIYLLGNKKMRFNALLGIGFLLLTELAAFSNTTVNDRVVMSSTDLTAKQGYNDYTADAIAAIKAADNGFYRIAKDYYPNAAMHICLNDPQMLNYKGITSYAEWNQPNYFNFLKEIHASNYADTDMQVSSKWVYGPAGRYLIYSLASVKYLLSRQKAQDFLSAGYTPVGTFGDVNVMRNTFSLPFGFSYDKYITLQEFRKINNLTRKDVMLLTAFIPPDTAPQHIEGLQELHAKDTLGDLTYQSYSALVSDLRKDSLSFSRFNDDHFPGTFTCEKKKLLFLTIPYDEGWKAIVDGKPAPTIKVTVGFTGLLLNKGSHTIELKYEVPFLGLGALVTLITLLLFVFALVKYRKARIAT